MTQLSAITSTLEAYQRFHGSLSVKLWKVFWTGAIQICRATLRMKTYQRTDSQSDWTKLLAGEIANFFIDRSRGVQGTVKILAICLNIDEFVHHHHEFLKACENFKKALCGDFSFYKKRRWNELKIEIEAIRQWHHFKQRMAKTITCFAVVMKTGLFCYTSSQELFASNPTERRNVVQKIFVDPKKALDVIFGNQERVSRVLQDYNLGMNGSDDLEKLKQQLTTVHLVQEKVTSVTGNVLLQLKRVTEISIQAAFNPIGEMGKEEYYDRVYRQFHYKESKEEVIIIRPYPAWLGEKLNLEDNEDSKEEEFLEIFDNFNNVEEKNLSDTVLDIANRTYGTVLDRFNETYLAISNWWNN